MAWFRKKQPETIPYDHENQVPAVRKSICTGEMTAGFVDRETGQFHDLMLLENQQAVERFCKDTGVKSGDLKVIY